MYASCSCCLAQSYTHSLTTHRPLPRSPSQPTLSFPFPAPLALALLQAAETGVDAADATLSTLLHTSPHPQQQASYLALLDPSMAPRLLLLGPPSPSGGEAGAAEAGAGEGLPDYDGTDPAGYLVLAGVRPALAKALAMQPGERIRGLGIFAPGGDFHQGLADTRGTPESSGDAKQDSACSHQWNCHKVGPIPCGSQRNKCTGGTSARAGRYYAGLSAYSAPEGPLIRARRYHAGLPRFVRALRTDQAPV